MGKAGRFACIFVPMVLTLASLICLLLVEIGGTNSNSAALVNMYFMEIDPSDLKDGKLKLPDIIPNTNVDNNLLASALSKVLKNGTDEIDITELYTVYLWNYCESKSNDNGNWDVKMCTKPATGFWFNPLQAWNLQNYAPVSSYPKEAQNGLKVIRAVSRWMFAAYAVAFFSTLAELVVGAFAVFSRWGSCVTSIVSSVSSLFTLAASATATALFGSLVGTVNGTLGKYGVHAHLGRSMMITTWLATAFSVAAGLFWLISICCCSGRSSSGSHKTMRVEKTPYTYERVHSPYMNQTGNTNSVVNPHYSGQYAPQQPVQMQQMNPGHNSQAYEPYRAAQV